MYKIKEKKILSSNSIYLKVFAPDVAKKRKPGQFIILRVDEKGERIPLTVSEVDGEYISIIFQIAGQTTKKLSQLKEGEEILDIVGPLGNPTPIEKVGRVVCVGGGLGVALVYPLIRAFAEKGNRVISIISARTAELLILKDKIENLSDEVYIATDDGSLGRKGYPTQILEELLEEKKVDLVVVVGPVLMMKKVAEITRKHNIKTLASLNSLMVDGTGMCGCCRVLVDGKIKFTCVDGPEFDAHKVDFDSLSRRVITYIKEEKEGKKYDFSDNFCQIDTEVLMQKEPGKREPMPHLPAEVRKHNFLEVALGYTKEQAIKEAKRCIQCRHPLCRGGCPVGIDIPAFIKFIAEGDFISASRKIKETSFLGRVCGRVCPAEDQCERVCIVGKKTEPVAIGYLERFCSDYEAEHTKPFIPQIVHKDKKVAVVGSGPAGLAAARDLALEGYNVVIFEALHKPGGVLVYGIPDFRLPKKIVEEEIKYLTKLGVDIKCNMVVGKTISLSELKKEFSAIFIAVGAGLPKFMNIEGEDLNGVFSANEYLTRINLMQAYRKDTDTPIPIRKKAVIIGGGNTAMDAARCAIRMQAETTLVYRRTEVEMPARPQELKHAKEEGLNLALLTQPVRIIGNKEGWVEKIECIKMQLGEPDASGRRKPYPVEGSNFFIDTDLVIEALGTGPSLILIKNTPDLELNNRGYIKVGQDMATNLEGVYAGGDIATGAATVILAMGAGRKAAKTIKEYLSP